jgi:urea transport system substrate-binding protein
MKRRQFLHSAATAAAVAGFGLSSRTSLAADDIKVGILHSQTGTMAVSEKPLLDMALMTIDEINQAGGIAGRKLVPVVSDPASDWPTYAKEARKMLENDKVAAVFGCWTSASRKEVLPVFKERDGLLFYPVQYEGEELERNVFYTGLAPNQQSIPALNYFYGDIGGAYRRFFLLGSDYVYPRTANRIIGNYLSRARGVAAADLAVEYTPLGHRDYADIVGRIKAFAAQGKKAMVVSTLNGDTNLHFFAALAQAGISANDVPVLSFSVDEALLGAAITEARALVTFDLHFSDIRRHDRSGTPGIVVPRLRSQSLPPVRRVALALAALLSSEPLTGRLWIVSDNRLRIWPADGGA